MPHKPQNPFWTNTSTLNYIPFGNELKYIRKYGCSIKNAANILDLTIMNYIAFERNKKGFITFDG